MDAVELFCGIGGFRIACDELGITTIWANDIDGPACSVYKSRFGNGEIVQGDINNYIEQIPDHDLLTGGFPCQPFSSAGYKRGIKDSRGSLFKSISDILKLKRPKFFVLENVKRLLSMQAGSHFATILSELSSLEYSLEWRVVRACDLGLPQHRERIFIIGTRLDIAHECPYVKLLTPEELLAITSNIYKWLTDFSKWKSIENHGAKFQFWGLSRHGRFIDGSPHSFSEKVDCPKFVSLLQKSVGSEFDFTGNTLERIKESTFVDRFFNGVKILYNQSGGARMGYTVFGTDGIAPTLTATPSRHYERYKINGGYRRLTNIEYARIQGFPDDHCSVISVYNQYQLYGNAVPPLMAKWAISKATSDSPTPVTHPKTLQLTLC